jgi:hypothetical protein
MASQFHGYIQLKGPLEANVELLTEMSKKLFGEDTEIPFSLYVEHIGIQSVSGHFCEINSEKIEIGITGILELRNSIITSFKFSQNEDEETIVDCFLTW